jgi:hypothetical protein
MSAGRDDKSKTRQRKQQRERAGSKRLAIKVAQKARRKEYRAKNRQLRSK